MDPKDFNWSEGQQVTVTNPTGNDFSFKVYGKEYVVESGATVKMPGYIAWIYVHKLSVQEAQKDGGFVNWNDKGSRQEYYSRYVVGADDLIQVAKPEPKFERLDTSLDVQEQHEEAVLNVTPMGVPADEESSSGSDKGTGEPVTRGKGRGRARRKQ